MSYNRIKSIKKKRAMIFDPEKVYEKFKSTRTPYSEKIHCPLLLKIMADKEKGSMASFCVEVGISDSTFYHWLNKYKVFEECYGMGKMVARDNWEKEGREMRMIPYAELGCQFEMWRTIGWSRFGIGKNSRIRLNLNPKDSPAQHYAQLLQQASQGEYTASEIKQLMEAVNVGLRAHEVFNLQQEIEQLKADIIKLNEIKNGENTYTVKGTS